MDGRCTLAFTLLLTLSQSFANGQESARDDDLQKTTKVPQISYLVLVDHQIIKGRCTPRPDGYDIQVAGGRMFIESNRIRFVAKSADDVYLQMRRSQGQLTPDVHMELARWCLSNDMKDFAELEVLDALRRDPNRTDAQRLLASLTRPDSTSNKTASGFTEYVAPKRLATDVETRSLAGLSRPVATDFTRHVQPIVVNKCATSGCHGVNSQSSFQLTSTARGANPVISERNLAAVMKQVDLTRPSSSPLLLVLEKAHGGQAVSMFRGRAGSLQMKVLRDWVADAANDIAPDANLDVKERLAELEKIRRQAMITSVREGSESQSPVHSIQETSARESNPHGRLKSIDETDQDFLAEAERTNADDAFSPSSFNRKYHGRTAPVDIEEGVAGASEADDLQMPANTLLNENPDE
jgi:hypothetical protein